MTDAAASVDDLLRRLGPQVLGQLVRRYGDFHHCEDAVQEALLAAVTQWTQEGIPDSPRGWLVTVAVRRMTDLVRSEEARRRREDVVAREPTPGAAADDRDDSLLLLFMCCHPDLSPGSAIPLTLRAVGGLTTAEIARAFLVPEPTMAQRISRAKARIKASDVPLGMPGAIAWQQRLRSVLHVLYLMFNEGYASSSGAGVARVELSADAIRLTRMLYAALPGDPEVAGLLALMLLTDARRLARTGPAGELVPLAEQDRACWDRALIAEGTALVEAALPKGAVGEYQLQAAIAAVHDEAASAQDTDWPQVAALYGLLERVTGNPMVTLNRAVAVAMVDGPAAGLALLEPLDAALAGSHRLDAVRAHLHELAGDGEAALARYRAAAARTTSLAERDYLRMRAARLASSLLIAPRNVEPPPPAPTMRRTARCQSLEEP